MTSRTIKSSNKNIFASVKTDELENKDNSILSSFSKRLSITSCEEDKDANFESLKRKDDLAEIGYNERIAVDDVDPKLLDFFMEGLELDESIEKLEGSIDNHDYLGERRRSSSCSSYGYIPIKTFKRFQM